MWYPISSGCLDGGGVDPISAGNLDAVDLIGIKPRWGGPHICRKPRWRGNPISAGFLDGCGDPISAGNPDWGDPISAGNLEVKNPIPAESQIWDPISAGNLDGGNPISAGNLDRGVSHISR